MGETRRKYAFSWAVMGDDIEDSRGSLGGMTHMEVYRLFQFTLKDVLEREFGADKTDELFRKAGVLAGRAFFEHYCKDVTGVSELAKRVQEKFRELGIGLVRFESVDLENATFQLTVDEDLDCSGLPDTSEQICVYDEGFIKGILDSFTGKEFMVREVDCWCSGARTCRFRAEPVK